MYRLPLLLSLLLPLCLPAQTTTDDFSDGDLLNPEWFGDLGKFEVADGQLRLNDESASGPAVLAVRTPVDPACRRTDVRVPGTDGFFSLHR